MVKKKRLEMEKEELEEKIAQIQKSTRTLIPALVPVHNQFRSQFRWYYKWHLTPFASLVHWITLFTSVMLFLLIVFGLVAVPQVKVEAATSTYTFSGITNPSSTHLAQYGDNSASPGTSLSMTQNETEFSNTGYTNVQSSNDTRETRSNSTASYYPVHDFRFLVNETVSTITQLDETWEGYGCTGIACGGIFGAWLYIWNNNSSAFELLGTHTNSSDTNLTGQQTSSFSNYIDGSGFLYLRALGPQRTTGVDNINTDYVQLIVTYTNSPAAPTGFSGTADSTSAITWNWTDNASNEDGYRVMNSDGSVNVSGDLPAGTQSWQETSLSVNTQYTRKARAFINGGGTADSGTDAKYTLANAPSAPTVSTVSGTSLKVVVNVNSNPASTEFAIQETGSSNYVQTNGSLSGSAAWQTYSNWGGASGINVTGLSPNTQYTFKVKARNGNNTETTFGGTASAYTATQTNYTFAGITNPSSTHKAEGGQNDARPGTSLTLTQNETEFSNSDYTAISSSDDTRATTSNSTSSYPAQDFRFKVNESVSSIIQIDETWEGWGCNGELNCNGNFEAYLYVWNNSTLAFELLGSHTNNSDTNLTGQQTSNFSNYIDGSGFLYLRVLGPLGGVFPNRIHTDFVQLQVTYGTSISAPTGFSGTADSTSQITWNWTDNASDETGYRVMDSSASTNISGDLPAGTQSWPETGLSVNTQYTRRAQVFNATNTANSDIDSVYTLANVPGTPTVTTVSASSLNILINVNSNPSNTEFAIQETISTNYVQSDGSLSASAAWQTYSNWGGASGIDVTGLSINTQYTFQVKARNGDNTETAFGSTASKYTAANTPSAPTVAAVSTSSLSVDVNANSNPVSTEFAIQETGSSNYVQADGTLDVSAAWQTDSVWGTINVTGLSVNTQYTFQVKARNGDNAETGFGSTASAYTLANAPGTPTLAAVSSSSLSVDVNPNSNPASTEFVIQETGSSNYVQADGTLDAGEIWQTDGVWGTKTVTGLSVNAQYTFQVKARNSDNTETSFGSSASAYTLANTPGTPTVSTVSSSSLNVIVTVNSNPSATEFAIQETSTGNYVQSAGTLGVSTAWQIYTNWGGASGINVTGLSASTQYTFQVKARNGDSTETSFGNSASGTTSGGQGGGALSAPQNLTISEITTTTAKASWDAISGATSYEISYGTDTSASNKGTVDGITTNYDTLTGLSQNTTYYVKVRAKNSNNTSSYSSIVNFKTSQDTSPAGNQGPVAKITGPSRVVRGTEITLDASGSYDPDGRIVKYIWTFGDEGITTVTPAPTTNVPTTPAEPTPPPPTAGTLPEQPTTPVETQPVQPTQPEQPPQTNVPPQSPDVTQAKPPLDKLKDRFNSIVRKIKEVTGRTIDKIRGLLKKIISATISSSLASTQTTEQKLNHTYNVTGRYGVALIVEDDGGKQDSTSIIVEVIPPAPIIDSATVNSKDALEIKGKSFDPGIVTLYLQSQPISVTTNVLDDLTFTYQYPKVSLDFSAGPHAVYGRLTDTNNITSDPSNSKDFQLAALSSLVLPNKPASKLEKELQKIWQPETVMSTVRTIIQLNSLLKPLVIALGLLAILFSTGFWEIPWYLYYLFVSFLEAVGLRKKRSPWGVIYDAVTKAPVPLAVVRIFTAKERKLLETRVTDRQGRFGFAVNEGEYYITVTKNGYTFASKLISPKTKQDDIYTNLYHGAALQIDPKSKGVINVNVPIDPMSEKAINEMESKLPVGLRALKKTVEKIRIFIKHITLPILITAIAAGIISVFLFPEIYTPIFIMLYILVLYREFKERQARATWGAVYDSVTKKPLSKAHVRIFDVETGRLRETKVTSSSGQFGFLVEPGKYYLKIQESGYQFPSKKVENKNDGGYHGVYTGGEIEKRKGDEFLSVNIPLDRVNQG